VPGFSISVTGLLRQPLRAGLKLAGSDRNWHHAVGTPMVLVGLSPKGIAMFSVQFRIK
jgi:hypothetical protein